MDLAASELDAEGDVVRSQIAAWRLVQRSLQDRMAVMHFRPVPFPLLANKGAAQCRVKIRVKAAERRLSVSVVTHLGRLSSLEFSKPPQPLLEQAFEIVAIEKDARHVDIAAAADHLEHGRS